MSPDVRGVARATDPSTSHEAMTHGTASDALRWELLCILADSPGGLSDDDAQTILTQRSVPFVESGATTRRGELVQIGLVHAAGDTLNCRRRRVTRWAVTPEGARLRALGRADKVAELFRNYRRHRPSHTRTSRDEALRAAVTAFLDAVEGDDREQITSSLGRLIREVRHHDA